jgi:hypothetical protein
LLLTFLCCLGWLARSVSSNAPWKARRARVWYAPTLLLTPMSKKMLRTALIEI